VNVDDFEVVEDPSVPPGTFYIGPRDHMARLFENVTMEVVSTEFTTEHDFENNRYIFRMNERLRLRVNRPPDPTVLVVHVEDPESPPPDAGRDANGTSSACSR
jgi:hypothetical protein